jgi:hypothetical protein
MQDSSLIIVTVFLVGCAVGALLNSLYRVAMLSQLKEAFEEELRP